jgi:hypothetical protein
MSALTSLLREHVTPLLSEFGFRREGRRYRLVAGNGDQAFVAFQRSRTDPGAADEFFVNLAVVPVPYWDWLRHIRPGDALTDNLQAEEADGLWRDRLVAPPQFAAGIEPWQAERWLLDSVENLPACGAALATALREQAVPQLTQLLDRREFLALSRDPARPLGPGVGPAELILLVDEGPSPELEAEIARCEALDSADYPVAGDLARWARARIAAS